MGLGKRLKNILNEKNMTIQRLSEITGISANTLYTITKRDNKSIRAENLQKIADALGVDIRCLISDEEPPKGYQGTLNLDGLTEDEILEQGEKLRKISSTEAIQKSMQNAIQEILPLLQDLTPEQMLDIKKYARFLKSQNDEDSNKK